MSINSDKTKKSSMYGKLFLWSGMAAEISYLLADLLGGYYIPEYNYFDNTASELMAIGATDRTFYAQFYLLPSLLIAFFGYGLIQRYADSVHRSLYKGGVLLITVGVCYAIACTIFPMDPPESTYTLSGWMHVFFVSTGVLSMLGAIRYLGRQIPVLLDWDWFKKFSYFCFPLVLIAGFLSPIILYLNIEYMGLTERIIGHVSSIWLFVLAYKLWQLSSAEAIEEQSNNLEMTKAIPEMKQLADETMESRVRIGDKR